MKRRPELLRSSEENWEHERKVLQGGAPRFTRNRHERGFPRVSLAGETLPFGVLLGFRDVLFDLLSLGVVRISL